MSGNETLRVSNRSENDRSENRAAFRPDPKILQAIEASTQSKDYFGYDVTRRPVDMVYQGKRVTVGGWDDRKHQSDLARTGWTMVPKDRHPECATDDPQGKIILIGGLALMERNEYYEKKARELESTDSVDRVKTQFERLQISDDPSVGPRTITKFNRNTRQAVPE